MATAPPVTSTFTRIGTEAEAIELAGRIMVPGRRDRPTVVITIPSGQDEPFVDPNYVAEELGSLAEVVVMPTSDVSWGFSHHMADATQVYGGAARVYPLGHDWVTDLRLSRLRFVYASDVSHRVADRVVQDALAAALAAGLVGGTVPASARRVSGRVATLLGTRAVVRLDDGGMASVWQELTVPDVPLDRVLLPGQRVSGTVDPTTNRLDLRAAVRLGPGAGAFTGTNHPLLGRYASGKVVLAQVSDVDDVRITVEVLPGVRTVIPHHLVTGNLDDRLTDLFTVGEVVAARVQVHHAGDLSLRLDDVDDDEPVVPAPSLVPGGPPWLVLPTPSQLAAPIPVPVAPVVVLPEPAQPPAAPPVDTAPSPATPAQPVHPTPADVRPGPHRGTPAPAPAAAAPRVPARHQPAPAASAGPATARAVTPRVLDKADRRAPPATAPSVAPAPAPAPEPVAPRSAARDLSLTLAAERARSAALERELDVLRASERARSAELDRLRANADALAREVEKLEAQATNMKTRYRNASLKLQNVEKSGRKDSGRASGREAERVLFADAEEQFRHEVYVRWAEVVPAGEKAASPLGTFTLGPEFLASLAAIRGVPRSKVVDVVVDVLSDDKARLASREVHRLRESEGTGNPVVRDSDGATCYRAYLQQNTPQARRLHYWRSSAGFELSRVVLHDDTNP